MFIPVLFSRVYTGYAHGLEPPLVLCKPAAEFSRAGVFWLRPEGQANKLPNAANQIVCDHFEGRTFVCQ